MHGVGADRTHHDDDRGDDGERDAQDRREQRHGGQNHDQADDVGQVHAGDQAPDEVLLFDEQQRPGLQPPDHQAAQQHRGRGRAGDAQRHHRQQRGAAGGVGRGLGGDHAFHLAGAELVAVF